MKIFISWSGDLSREIAQYLKEWFGYVLQEAEVFVSSEDIRKGQRWGFEVAKELEESNFGIICLTKKNLNSPWILFEAGALSKHVQEANVSTLLINDLSISDVVGPLSQFQHTVAVKEDFQKLVCTINEKLGNRKLEELKLRKIFDKWWPELESNIAENIDKHEDGVDAFEKRSDRELLSEILGITRFLATRSIDPSEIESLFEKRFSKNRNLMVKDDMLLSPTMGEFNHPYQVKIYPISIDDSGQKKLVSACITNGKIEISEMEPPLHMRGVKIAITFYSETDTKFWKTEFQFHKGATYVDTDFLEVDVTDPFSENITIWRE